jgi:hypothetical protein
VAGQPRVLGKVDLAHAPGPEETNNRVAGEDFAATQRHGRNSTNRASARQLIDVIAKSAAELPTATYDVAMAGLVAQICTFAITPPRPNEPRSAIADRTREQLW